MKLSKEEIQKLALSSILMLALLYGYVALMLGPTKRSAVSLRSQMEELQPKIDAAKKQLRATNRLEAESGQVSEKIERIKSLIPNGSPIAWFPPRVVDIFERFEVEDPTVRSAGAGGLETPESFRSLQWLINVPAIDYARLGGAVAELENREPLMRIKRMEIEMSEDVEKQHAMLTVANIVRNEE